MKKFGAIVLCVLVMSIHLFADTVTIVPFAYQGISQGDAETFTEMFVSEYAAVTHDDVADRSNFDGIAEQHKFQLTDWSNNDKIAKLGKAMNAGKIICGRISVFGSAVTFTGRVLDVNSTKVLNSTNWKGKSLESLLFDITNIAKKLAGRYSIGEKGPGGGVIFYESEAGFLVYESDDANPNICHYLEVFPKALNNYHADKCDLNYNIETSWDIGGGKLNTKNMVDAHVYPHPRGWQAKCGQCPAKLCLEFYTKTTNIGEWYLPNKTELELIYKELICKNLGIDNGWYWSSSWGFGQFSYTEMLLMGSQFQFCEEMSVDPSVLAVRAF